MLQDFKGNGLGMYQIPDMDFHYLARTG